MKKLTALLVVMALFISNMTFVVYAGVPEGNENSEQTITKEIEEKDDSAKEKVANEGKQKAKEEVAEEPKEEGKEEGEEVSKEEPKEIQPVKEEKVNAPAGDDQATNQDDLPKAVDKKYGNSYDHIDVKVNGTYTVKVDGKDYMLNGQMEPKTIKVQVGSKTFNFSSYTINTVTETTGEREYEIKKTGLLKAADIAWVNGTFKMSNVYVSATMLFEKSSVSDEIKDILKKKTYNGKEYYYTDVTNYKYDGVNECTGGKGMRSLGKTGTPTGLDIYLQASGLNVVITKGKLAIKKEVKDEAGNTLTGDTSSFEYTITDQNGKNLYFKDGACVSAGTTGASDKVYVQSGKTVTLLDIPEGTYTITEKQKEGYVIHDIGGKETENYSTDYVVKVKEDSEIPVAIFTNTKLAETSAICLQKTAEGLNGTYPNPTVSIFAAANGEKTGNALWTGELPANGDKIYPTVYFTEGTYIVEETGCDVTGYECTGTVNGSEEMTFAVTKAGDLVNVNIKNTYEAEKKKIKVTIKGKNETKVYNANEQLVEGFTFEAIDTEESNVDGVSVTLKKGFEAKAKGTNVDQYRMNLTKDAFNVEAPKGYTVADVAVVDGYLKIEPYKMTVEVAGNNATLEYNGEEQSVSGFKAYFQGTGTAPGGFDESKVLWKGGKTPIVKGKDVIVSKLRKSNLKAAPSDAYLMGLESDDFTYNDKNFSAKFEIEDGWLKVAPRAIDIKIKGNKKTEQYDGTEKSVSGYEAVIPTGLDLDPANIGYDGVAEAMGIEVGTYPMYLNIDNFFCADSNYDATFILEEDGQLTITPEEEDIIIDPDGPVEPDDPTEPEEKENKKVAPEKANKPKKALADAVSTDDATNITLWSLAMTTAIIAIAAAMPSRRRKG